MDRRDQSIRHTLRHEIRQYGKLKNAWGLGHIQVKRTKNDCTLCLKKHYTITGYYRDYYELTKQSVYLGSCYATAHLRLNHVKSFL